MPALPGNRSGSSSWPAAPATPSRTAAAAVAHLLGSAPRCLLTAADDVAVETAAEVGAALGAEAVVDAAWDGPDDLDDLVDAWDRVVARGGTTVVVCAADAVRAVLGHLLGVPAGHQERIAVAAGLARRGRGLVRRSGLGRVHQPHLRRPRPALGRPPRLKRMSYAGDVTPAEAFAAASEEDALLVDVRTRAEWTYVGVPDLAASGHRVAFVEWSTFPDGRVNERFVDDVRAAGHAPGRPVYLICRSGVRSVAAATALTAAGLGPAYNVLEGFEGPHDAQGHRTVAGWKNAGLPWRQG